MTLHRMRAPLLTIAFMLSLGFVTRYGGTDATLGLAFTQTGVLYPFFAAMLGWLGVALTGSDTSSNVLFGSLQKITAQQLGLNPILITTANSTGGVMGKMIDAQSIVVATAATEPARAGRAHPAVRLLAQHRAGRDHGHHRDAAGLRVPVDGAVAMTPSFLRELRRIAGDDGVFSEPLEVLTYECDALPHLRAVAGAVVLPSVGGGGAGDRPAVRDAKACRSWRAGMAPACRAARCRSTAAS